MIKISEKVKTNYPFHSKIATESNDLKILDDKFFNTLQQAKNNVYVFGKKGPGYSYTK